MFVDWIDSQLVDYKPWQIVALTLSSAVVCVLSWTLMRAIQKNGFKNTFFLFALKALQSVPGGNAVIESQSAKVTHEMTKKFAEESNLHGKRTELPKEGWEEDHLFSVMNDWKESEEKIWKTGQVSGVVYHGGEDLGRIICKAYSLFEFGNPLHPDVFPYIRKMEAEIVRMSVTLFHGGKNHCGAMTSGGTESIITAMKAYREWGRMKGIRVPEIIAPTTAHAAFDKAAEYFGIKLVKVPVNENFEADVPAMEKEINSSTVGLVGSAIQFPNGILDPIPALSDLALKHKLLLHVDCCLGGFLLPFLHDAGYDIPPFDFSLPGVTSISADMHKYAFAPKGCSVVMYSSEELRKCQYFVVTDWPGGIYASPGIQGSRAGGIIAGCWAAMMKNGYNGYVNAAKAIMKEVKIIENGLRSIKGISVLGHPAGSVVSFTSDVKEIGDVYKLAEAMKRKGWNLNILQFPRAVHIACTFMHQGRGELFIKNIKEAIEEVKQDPDRFNDGTAAVYGMADTLPDRSLLASFITKYLDALYQP